MHVTSSGTQRTNSVMAMFDDGLSTFLLSCGATFGELAARLDHLAEHRRQVRPPLDRPPFDEDELMRDAGFGQTLVIEP